MGSDGRLLKAGVLNRQEPLVSTRRLQYEAQLRLFPLGRLRKSNICTLPVFQANRWSVSGVPTQVSQGLEADLWLTTKLTFSIELDGVTVAPTGAPRAVEDRSSLGNLRLRRVGLGRSDHHARAANGAKRDTSGDVLVKSENEKADRRSGKGEKEARVMTQ